MFWVIKLLFLHQSVLAFVLFHLTFNFFFILSQTTSSRLDGSHDGPNVKMGTGLGSSASKGAQSGASKSAPSGLSPEAYCHRHEISVIVRIKSFCVFIILGVFLLY